VLVGLRQTRVARGTIAVERAIMKKLLLTAVAALLMATSAAHARPVSKSQSWKLIQGTWCVGDQPSDNEAYVGIARDKCGENEQTLIIRENGYRWEHEAGLSCRYLSGKARLDKTIPTSTKTVGVWVFHIIAGCLRRPAESAIGKYTQSFDMYVSKGTLWIENLRSDERAMKIRTNFEYLILIHLPSRSGS
jgi:hypothetical protein